MFCPPLDSKRSLFKGMIPNGNLNNICNRLVLYRFILMKTYFLWNWANSRCYLSPRSQLRTKLFKLIKKSRDKSLIWRKTKLPQSERFLQGPKTVNKVHHFHLCQCTILILMGNIHNFYQTDLPQLFYMILHFRCKWKKFIVHLCYRGKIHPQLERRTHWLKSSFLYVKLGQRDHYMVD